MCARCIRRMECRFRQQGTWVVECEYFRESPKVKRDGPVLEQVQRREALRQPKLA